MAKEIHFHKILNVDPKQALKVVSNFNEYSGERTLGGFTGYLSQNVSGQVAQAPDQAASVM